MSEDAAGGEFAGDHSERIVMAEPAGRVITAALAAAHPGELIAGRPARERIAMTNLLTGETFGRQANVCGR